MRLLRLPTKIFLVSGATLVLFCCASFWILYRAQTELAVQEMDTLLANEVVGLSALVSAKTNGSFDFEMSPFFLAQYQRTHPSGFFRITDAGTQKILKQSLGAPSLNCETESQNISSTLVSDQVSVRVKTVVFHPELESDAKVHTAVKPSTVCLIVGINQKPYKTLVIKNLLSTVPVLMAFVLFLIGLLSILVRSLTRDLSVLTSALETSDFGATHEFPSIPAAYTPEVKAVVEKLVTLHTQAADVYREMWLFLGRAAHQLKTPVSAIQTTLQVLLRKERSKEELISGLADVEVAVNMLVDLTKRLISSSRISYEESSARVPIELKDFFNIEAKILKSQANEYGISINILSVTSENVLANSLILSEIFGNLLENAILYSPRRSGASVNVSWALSDQNVIVSIRDEGKGFPKEVLNNLFEPFVRGDEREVTGSGLGLSIAKKSAQLLGGTIKINKSDAHGSEVIVILPICFVPNFPDPHF